MKTITGKIIAIAIALCGIIFSHNSWAACNAPSGMNTTSITSSSATLNWNAVSNASLGYNVRYRVVGASTWTSTTSTTNSKSITSLNSSANYEWQVQSKCSSTQTSSWTTSSTFTTLIQCNVPSGLSTSNVTSTGATLNWTAVSGAQSYNIQYRVVGATSWTSTTSTSNSKTLTSLTATTNYEWQIQTNCGSSNTSAYSSSATFTTSAPPCNVATGLNTTGITPTSATLNWTAVSGASGYNIRYRIVGDPSWINTTSVSVTKTINSLTSAANYEWQVQTDCGNSNTSSYSSSSNFSTPVPPCNTPSSLNTTGVTPTSATLNWNAVSGAIGYNVQYRGIGEPSWTSSSITSTSLTINNLSAITDYEWQVQTDCGNSNTSSFSTSSNFTTHAPPCGVPAGLNVTNITLTDATLNWTAVSNATDYKIRYREIGVSSWTNTSSNSTSEIIAGLNSHVNYEWQVQAVCGNINAGVYSQSSYFTSDPSIVPISVFYGTWAGVDQNGNAIEIFFNQNGIGSFTINGIPTDQNNPIVAYRLPQYMMQSASALNPDELVNSAGEEATVSAASPQRVIKFYSDNAIHGKAGHPAIANNSSSGNSLVLNSIPEIYTAVALVSQNGFGLYEMSLFVDLSQFSAQPPAVDFTQNPLGDIPPYAVLIKQ